MKTELENFVGSLNEQEKQTLRELLDQDLKSSRGNGSDRPTRNFGWARGKIRIASDFDEPLEAMNVGRKNCLRANSGTTNKATPAYWALNGLARATTTGKPA